MESDSSPARDGVIARIKESPSAQLWLVAIAAILFFLVFKIAGSFVAEIFGGFVAIIIWVGLSARILWTQSRWKRGRRGRRLHSDDIVSSMPDHAAALFQNRLDDDVRRDANRR